jgi:hypothetical protein
MLQRSRAVTLNLFAQIADDAVQSFVAAGLIDRFMEFGIHINHFFYIVALDRFHFFCQ